MASLIDSSYFHNDLQIGGLDAVSREASLQSAINRYEPEYLQRILGPSLYTAFKEGTDGVGEAGPDTKWTVLTNGATWTDSSNRKRIWGGFKNDQKISPIAGYVFYWFIRNTTTQTMSVGEVRTLPENSKIVSPAMKLCTAWNRMVEMNAELIRFLDGHPDYYGEWWRPALYYGIEYTGRELFHPINTFGI